MTWYDEYERASHRKRSRKPDASVLGQQDVYDGCAVTPADRERRHTGQMTITQGAGAIGGRREVS